MSTLESTVKITPKSILRYRPIGESTSSLGKRSIVTTAAAPITRRASRPRVAHEIVAEWQRADPYQEEEEVLQSTQTVARRTNSVPPRAHSTTYSYPPVITRSKAMQAHPLLYLGLGMIAMLLLWMLVSTVFGWFTTTLDDIRYGRPRTFQTDAWVGHNERGGTPSHFIAINLHSHIEIIEMPGGDASRARIYMGPQLYGNNDDLTSATLRFVDVNGDHKPDMLLSFQNSKIVFINAQGSFRPLQPGERSQVERSLQRLGL